MAREEEDDMVGTLLGLVDPEQQEQPADLDVVKQALTFDDAGLVTGNAGFVLRMHDGSEYQVTVVKSK